MDKTVLYNLSYGIYAIGVKDNNRDCGCIINTVFQISNEGPLIAISMNKDNYTYELIKRNNRFSVSILSEDSDPQLISKLGFTSGKDNNKWDGIKSEYFNDLIIAKENCLGYMDCEVINMVDANTHYVILAKVKDAKKDYQGVAMTYDYYHNVIKGKAPKKAPTYQEEPVEKVVKNDQGQWVCSVCGYVYDGEDFEKEGPDYVCPICGVPKDLFEKR